jgi:hypothetical protein
MGARIPGIILAAFLLCAAVSEIDAMGGRGVPQATPDKDARGLLHLVTVTDPYTRWKSLSGDKEFQAGTKPHGPFVVIYLNDAAFRSLGQGKEMARGSICVIENYNEEKVLTGFGVMHKVPGFNPDGGNWYWMRSTRDGKIEFFGRVEACIDCHRKAKTDFMFLGDKKGEGARN